MNWDAPRACVRACVCVVLAYVELRMRMMAERCANCEVSAGDDNQGGLWEM